MDVRHEKAIRRLMAQTTELLIGIMNAAPHRTPGAEDLKIEENITDALKAAGVSEADIEAAQKG